jgi:histidinol-phosphatase
MSVAGDAFLDQALETAREAAAAAAAVIAHYYRREFAVETKSDASPVTIADREAEIEIKRVLKGRYPGHGYYGEEFGSERGDAEHLWLIDPIDGTKSFVRGYPFFSTQIALMLHGELVLGVSSAAQFGEVAWARRGGGAFLDGERITAARTARIEDAALSTGNLKTLAAGPGWGRLAQLVRRANRSRGYGDFYHYHLLARGAIDAVIESDVNILDIAALVVIAREAGAVFTDLSGAGIGLETTTVLAATPALHPQLLNALAY